MNPKYKDLRRVIAETTSEMARFRQLVSCCLRPPRQFLTIITQVVNTVLATDIVDDELKKLRNLRWEMAFDEAKDDDSRDNINRKATIVIEHLIQARYVILERLDIFS